MRNVDADRSADNVLKALEVAGMKVSVSRDSRTTPDGKTRVVFSVFGKNGMEWANHIL